VARYPVHQTSSDILQSLDDIGNAKRLIGLFGTDLRFIPERKAWLVWDGERWQFDEYGVATMELAKAAVGFIDTEAALANTLPGIHDAESLVKPIRKWARSSSMLAKLQAMLDLAGKDPSVSLPAGRLDSEKMLLGVANGVINLKTGKLCQNRKEDYITRFSPVSYDSTANCELWLKFLNRVTGLSGVEDLAIDEHKRIAEFLDYLQRVVGYSLTGRTDEQVLFFLHGNGANGKTVFMNLLE
jgi:putative DNA primase/helicase